MMAREWTDNQKLAIKARGEQVLISAAAGSGKTAVLTERVKNILCDIKNPCASSELLVVTFTKAAAGEMRERIAKALKDEIKVNVDNRLYLKNQLALLPAADICTIDSFCAKIVRENFHIAEISSDFTVIDDNDHKVLKSESVTEILDELYENEDESFKALKKFFMSERDDRELENAIIKLYEFSRSYPSPEKWLSEIAECFNPDKDINTTVFAKEIYKYCKLMLDYYILLLEDLLSKLIYDIKEENDVTSYVRGNIKILKSLFDACDECNWDYLVNTLRTNPIAKYPSTLKGSDYYKIINKALKDCSDDLLDLCKKNLPTADENKGDLVFLYPIVKKLCEAVNMFSQSLKEKKKELNAFSFDDILHKCIDLLVVFNDDGTYEKTPLAKELSEKYKEILIDEYQDTNEAQNIIFEIVSKNKKNFYCVGDVKQSIYRFRLASPELFMKLKDSLPINNDTKNGPSQIILEQNFRSRKGVTDCVNFIFQKLMTKEVGEVKYNENEFLYCGAKYEEMKQPSTELHVLDGVTLNSSELTEREAEYIAKYIKETVESGIKIKDKDDNYRKVEYSDFCILMRSPKDKVDVYSETLSSFGIPSVFENNEVNVTSKEIMLFVSLIKAVNNPLIDVPLVSVMLSSLFGFTADELAEIRLIDKNSDVYTCLLEYAKTNKKAESFIRKLDFYRNIASSYPIYDFVKLLADDSAIQEIFLSTENGEERIAGIQSILDCAKSFTDNGRYGLSSFIRYLDSVVENAALVKKNTSLQTGVKIMTIHKSKGLEFPFVILTDCSKSFNLRDSYNALTVSRETGLGIKIRDDDKFTKYGTLSSLAGEKAIKLGDMSEELRILYVALTRAKEHLILVCSLATKTSKERISNTLLLTDENRSKYLHPFNVYNSKNLTEWLLSSFIFHKEAKALRDFFGVETTFVFDSDFDLDIKITDFNNSDEELLLESSIEEPKNVDEALLASIKEKAEYIYPFDELSTVLAKRTASSVEKHISSREYFASKKPNFIGEAITGATKGTAVHKFLELCDFKTASVDLESEINRMKNEYKLTEAELEVLDKVAVNEFFNSNVGKRLLNSQRVMKEYGFSVLRKAGEFYPELSGELKNEQIVIEGKLDCAFLEDDGIVLIDYKTDNISDENKLLEMYKSQLDVYKSALEECEGVPVKEVYLYSFKLKRFIRR